MWKAGSGPSASLEGGKPGSSDPSWRGAAGLSSAEPASPSLSSQPFLVGTRSKISQQTDFFFFFLGGHGRGHGHGCLRWPWVAPGSPPSLLRDPRTRTPAWGVLRGHPNTSPFPGIAGGCSALALGFGLFPFFGVSASNWRVSQLRSSNGFSESEDAYDS